MKNTPDTITDSDKVKFLKKSGWVQYGNDDNWINKTWIEDGLDYTKMVLDLDSAYATARNVVRIIKPQIPYGLMPKSKSHQRMR